MSGGVTSESPISKITQAVSGALRLSSQPPASASSQTIPTEGSDATGPQATDEVFQHPPLPPLSKFSSPAVGEAAWCAHDFLLGAAMVIIQQKTHKIVVVHDTARDSWFFPRGRKDVGESIETTAFREAYEESGYRVKHLPLIIPSRQPHPPAAQYGHSLLNTEPIYLTMSTWLPRMTADGILDDGGQYLTTWYAGQISENAVPKTGTGMPDEQNYRSYLCTYEEALQRVWGSELCVLRYVWDIYCHTRHVLAELAEEEKRRAERRRAEQRARARSSWATGPSICIFRRSTTHSALTPNHLREP